MSLTHINQHNHINNILSIIRNGIQLQLLALIEKRTQKEGIKNQDLADELNIIGTTLKNEKLWYGCQKENVKASNHREDIFFYLKNSEHSRVFFIEAKRLPILDTIDHEEYIKGNDDDHPSGGIERYKLGLHGDPEWMNEYGMIGYIENKSIEEWLEIINQKLTEVYPEDSTLVAKKDFENEYFSTHKSDKYKSGEFSFHHFWIDLT
jgi:hypothetical protein